MNFTVIKFLTIRQLRARWPQAMLTIVGVAGGVCLHLSVKMINRSVLDFFQHNVESIAGQASLFVSAGESGFNEKEVTEKVQKIKGINFVAPVIESRAYLYTDDHAAESLMIFGVDLLKEKGVRSYRSNNEEIIDDPLEFFNQPDSLIIPRSLALRLHLEVNSKIRLSTTLGSKTFTVRGLLDDSPFAKAFGGGIGLMDINGAQFTFGKEDKLDRLDLVLEKDQNVEDVILRLRSELGPGFTVERPANRSEATERTIHSYQFLLEFLASLALIVGLILVYTMISRFVIERRQEIGTYRALGATRGLILFGCVSQGLVQGFLGGMLGAFVAIHFANFILASVLQSYSDQFDMVLNVDHVSVSWKLLVMSVAEGSFVAGVAALIPALRAMDVSPVEALRKGSGSLQMPSVWLGRVQIYLGLILAIAAPIGMYFVNGNTHLSLNFASQIAFVFGTILVVSFLSARFIRLLAQWIGWDVSRLWRLGLENILRNPILAMQNSAIISIGVVIICIVQGSVGSFRYSFAQWGERKVYWDLDVTAVGDVLSHKLQPLRSSIGDEILAIEGVETPPSGKLLGIRKIKMPVDGREILVEAIDDPGTQEGRDILLQSEDTEFGKHVFEMYQANELLVLASEGFLRQSHKKIGDHVKIPSPSGDIDARIVSAVNDFLFPGGTLYLDRKKYESIWKDALVSSFGVKVKKGADVETVRKSIDGTVARQRDLMVLSTQEVKNLVYSKLNSGLTYLESLKFAVVILIAISLINTFLVTIIDRNRELGMMRAVGTSRRQLTFILLSEYITQGVICALLAMAVSLPTLYVFIRYSVSNLLGWNLIFHYPFLSLLEITIAGILMAAVAGLLPILHATRIEIREALRYE